MLERAFLSLEGDPTTGFSVVVRKDANPEKVVAGFDRRWEGYVKEQIPYMRVPEGVDEHAAREALRQHFHQEVATQLEGL